MAVVCYWKVIISWTIWNIRIWKVAIFFLFGATANELLEILSEMRKISKYWQHCRDSDRGLSLPIDQPVFSSVALINQHANRMRHNILSSVVSPNLQYFSLYLIKGTIFRKKIIGYKNVFWFYLQLSSEKVLILRNNELISSQMNTHFHVK